MDRRNFFKSLVVGLGALSALPKIVEGAKVSRSTMYFTGGFSGGDWDDARNWSRDRYGIIPGRVPGSEIYEPENVVVKSGTTCYTPNRTISLNNLNLESDSETVLGGCFNPSMSLHGPSGVEVMQWSLSGTM
jgi:hypothetical protein